ncbi:MAG: hypothetical protein N3B10_15600 [Armatimonadetes bacterium]|nr:hypothetical protein [Armatimonadota bacterium]
MGDDITFELGAFKVNGQWESKWQFRSSTWSMINDLNGDEIPEVLTFQGQVFPYPIFWWRTGGVWRKQNLVGSSLLRTINGWLHGPENFVFPECRTVARWEGKKWFVVIWKDGVVQAVTLKR